MSIKKELKRARENWVAGQVRAAVGAVHAALRAAPNDRSAKELLVLLLRYYPAEASPEMAPLLLRLLRDPETDPELLNRAGWMLLRRVIELLQDAKIESDLAQLTRQLENDELSLTLLRESPVGDRVAERTLTRVRRWLATSGYWRDHLVLVDVLGLQTNLNGGAWPFDEVEQILLERLSETAIARAYVPDISSGRKLQREDLADGTVRAVAEQYERWPYPVWRRITFPSPSTLPKRVRKLDARAAEWLRADSSILVAGCGTGREAALIALKYPDARVTAIDISDASLKYARVQCADLHIPPIRFIRLDLHDAAALAEKFDAIVCSGVLHHLPDPEAGWAALNGVLRPGGVMKIMLYSQLGRFAVRAAQELFRDLVNDTAEVVPRGCLPIDSALLRRVRHRLLMCENPSAPLSVIESSDFSTLAGTHDLLLHRHADPFNISRIARALESIGLDLLSFIFPNPEYRTRYDILFPEDSLHRDFRALSRFELLNPDVFAAMYEFWCYKPLDRC